MEILIPILAVTVIGLICAVGLAVASSVMAVKEDTRFTEIRACLPGANCGACGYTGCDGYAKALLEPGTKTNLCVPGADAVAAQIAALVQLVEIVLKRYIPALHKSLGVYLPLITTNCGVLGVTMNNISDGLNYVDSLLTALGCGLGFFMAMVIFSGVRSRVEDAEPPKSFEGLPITLVSASIVSLSFFGFSGVLDRLFGG